MSEEQYNDWYKKQFNNLNEEPPVEVWKNISSQLDVQDVWTGVDSKLNSIDRRKKVVRKTTYSLLLLLFLVFLGNYIINLGVGVEHKIIITNNSDKKPEIKNNFASNEQEKFQRERTPQTNSHSNNDIVENQSLVSNNKFKGQTSTLKTIKSSTVNANKSITETIGLKTQNESYVSNNLSIVKTSILNAKDQNSLPINKPSANISIAKDSINIKEEETNQGAYVATIIDNKILPDTSTENDSDKPVTFPIIISFIPVSINDSIIPELVLNSNANSNLSNEFQGWYVGGIGSINNIWLFNQLAFDGLSPNSLNQTNLNFGYAYGISFGYNFNSNYGGEMNWLVNSQQGQTYNRYNEGRYQTSHIKLNYSIVNLSLKHRKNGISKWFNVPKSNNLLIGVNCAFLTKSDDNSEPTEAKSSYSSTDYGLRLGYEYEILAFKRIIFSSTLNGNFGLKNIYKGNSLTPGDFNRTHTASFGLQLGIKYLFR